MSSCEQLSDEAQTQLSLRIVPLNAVRVQPVTSIQDFKMMGLDFWQLRKAVMIGENLYVDNRTLL